MKITPDVAGSMLRRGSLLFWCTLVVPVAIIAIGMTSAPAAARTSEWCAGVHWPKDRNPILFTQGTSETVEFTPVTCRIDPNNSPRILGG